MTFIDKSLVKYGGNQLRCNIDVQLIIDVNLWYD